MLDFGEDSYLGSGVYVDDAITFLRSQHEAIDNSTIRLTPRAEGDLSTFGWAPDGDIANGTRAFALSAMALYAVFGHWQPNADTADVIQSALGDLQPWPHAVPEAIVKLLTDIRVNHIARGSASARVVQNLIDSAIGHTVNRSIEDPTFLAKEMHRCNIQQHNVKTVMALYKQRCLANPALQLKAAVEEATLRFMQYDKVAVGTQAAVAAHVRERTWQRCSFTCASFMAPHFVVGAKLGSWLDDFLVKHAVQTAEGQLLAVELAIAQTPPGAATITASAFGDLCATCGLWILIRDQVLPQLAIGGVDVDRFAAEFRASNSQGAMHQSILSLRSMDPDVEIQCAGDFAEWVAKNCSAVRSCRDTVVQRAHRQHGRNELGMSSFAYH